MAKATSARLEHQADKVAHENNELERTDRYGSALPRFRQFGYFPASPKGLNSGPACR
jgi:hypothetical protein